jgi:hypothetical protein
MIAGPGGSTEIRRKKMYNKEIEAKVTELVQQKCEGITGNQITAKDFNKIQKAFAESVGETFGLEKTPRVRDFGLDLSANKLTGSFQLPVTLGITLPGTTNTTPETPQETQE